VVDISLASLGNLKESGGPTNIILYIGHKYMDRIDQLGSIFRSQYQTRLSDMIAF